MVKLSVVVPVYNCEKYILKCIDSIYNTKFSNEFEVIIINDGSFDNTIKICNDFKYDNLTIINNEKNCGVSYSRNKGIEKAKGKYLLFVDADDYLDKDWYVLIRDKIKLNKDVLFISNKINEDINVDDLLLHILCINKPYLPGPVNKVYNRKFLVNNKIKFNEKMMSAEDIVFNLKVIDKISSYSVLNLSYYNYRVHRCSCTKSFNFKLFESYNEFNREVIKFVKKKDISETLKNKIINNNIYMSTYALFHRLSFISYFKNKKLYRFVYYDPYKIVLSRKDNTNDYVFKLKIFFFLVRCRAFFLIWLILRIVNFINFFCGREKIVKNNI